MLIYFNDWHFFFTSWKCLCLCLFVYSSVCVLREECEGGHKILFPTLFTPVSTQHTGGQCWVRHLNKSHCCSWTHHSNRLPFKYSSIFLQSFNIWYYHWLTVLTQNLVIMNTEDEQQARDAEIRQVIIDSVMNEMRVMCRANYEEGSSEPISSFGIRVSNQKVFFSFLWSLQRN